MRVTEKTPSQLVAEPGFIFSKGSDSSVKKVRVTVCSYRAF